VRGLGAWTVRRRWLVSEGLQGGRRPSRDSRGSLDVEHDVDIVGWAYDIESSMDAMELSHQSADERPGLVRKD
jgi:hypothetical protein